MPGFNRRGPEELGPMTGRGMGYCMGYVRSEEIPTAAAGRGGRGRRNRFMAAGRPGLGRWANETAVSSVPETTLSSEGEISQLRIQVRNLTSTVEKLMDRLQEIEKH